MQTTFGKLNDGREVILYAIENDHIMMKVMNYGATLVSFINKDTGIDVVEGFESVTGYLNQTSYIGASIGRTANRIEKGKFTLNGKEYTLPLNNNGNCNHGGLEGFDKKIWNGVEEEDRVTFRYTSADGEEGYPGNLFVKVTYALLEDGISIKTEARSDADTLFAYTNHSYFNLAGHASGTIDNQILQINSEFYTPNDSECMPTGEVLSVMGTPFDFRAPKPIGQDINADFEQIEMFGGYDHNFAISGRGYRLCAIAKCLENGITMEVYTDKPGVQLYTSNGLPEGIYKEGAKYSTHQAFCLETQYFPNGMKNSHFIAPILKVGDEYNFTTEYKFIVK